MAYRQGPSATAILDSRRSPVDDRLEPGPAAEVVEVRVAAGAGGSQRRNGRVDALEHIKRLFLVIPQCQQAGDV